MLCLVAQSCTTFVSSWTVACKAPLSMGILQARILEWDVMPSSRGSSQPRYWTQVSRIAGSFFTSWATREAQSYMLVTTNAFKKMYIRSPLERYRVSQVALIVTNLLLMQEMQETQVQSLGWENPLEKEMATCTSTLAWKIPWTDKPCRLQTIGLQTVRHNWATEHT